MTSPAVTQKDTDGEGSADSPALSDGTAAAALGEGASALGGLWPHATRVTAETTTHGTIERAPTAGEYAPALGGQGERGAGSRAAAPPFSASFQGA